MSESTAFKLDNFEDRENLFNYVYDVVQMIMETKYLVERNTLIKEGTKELKELIKNTSKLQASAIEFLIELLLSPGSSGGYEDEVKRLLKSILNTEFKEKEYTNVINLAEKRNKKSALAVSTNRNTDQGFECDNYNINNIPMELQNKKAWVCVKFKTNVKGELELNKKGKAIKLPITTHGYNAKSNDKKTWNKFDNCVNYYKNNTHVKGIGFMLSMDDDYVFIDIDNININTAEKTKFINKFNSYTELSQSNTGYHIIVKVSDKKKFEQWAKDNKLIGYGTSIKNTLSSKHGDYEIYIEKRYFWLTGNVVENKTEIKEITFDELKNIFEFIESKSKKSLSMDDNKIIDLASKATNGNKFLSLYNEVGQDGNSEGDLSFASILAFYTQDKNQIKNIMLNSPRYRGKFEKHPTYLDSTIVKALNSISNTYNPNYRDSTNKSPEEKFQIIANIHITEILAQGAILPDDMNELPWIIEDFNENTGKFKTSLNTGYLAKFLRENINYIFVRESAKEGIQRFIYNSGVYSLSSDYDFRGMIKKYIPESLLKMGMVNEVKENLYTDEKYYTYSKLNPEKYINFKDGLLNIETWKLEPHTPNILTTIQLPINYPKDNNKTNNSIFDNYMNYLTDNDQSKKQLILEFMGVALSNIYGHRMKKSLFMVGPHNTGKSKIKELLIKLLGEQNANTLDLETLEARFGSSNVFNKRLIGSNDMSFIKVKELKVFKLITGGDTLFMEMKGENGFNAKFNGVAWFCCNELPKFGGDKGEGVYNRFAIVECNKTPIPEEKQNKKLLENMFAEKDYIVYLALEALKNVIKNNYNYTMPQSSIDVLESYKIDNDSFLRFLNECTTERPQGKIIDSCTCKRVYDVYSEWCKDNNNGYKDSKKECKEKLETLGKADKKIIQGNHYYSQFTLTIETKNDYKKIYGNDSIQ